MRNELKLSIIIPVFRGEYIIEALYEKIKDSLTGYLDFEVLFICDNCNSKSLEVVKDLNKKDPEKIKIFRLARNYGQHRALQFGFGKSTGDFVVTMDEDLQHDPADIKKLVEKQKLGNFDVVYARFNDLQHKGMRNKISFILRRILKHFIPNLYDNYSPYRLIKREIAIRTSVMVCPYTFVDDFLSRVTQNIAFEDIRHYKRMEGKSSYSFYKLLKHGILILLAYSKLIPILLAIAGIFVITGSTMFIFSIISPESLHKGIIKNQTIIVTIGIGIVFIFLSFLGSFINHRNSHINTTSIKLIV